MNGSNSAVLADENLFEGKLGGMSGAELLAYFQNKGSRGYFPLAKGKEKHLVKAQAILANEFDFNNEAYCLGERFDWKRNPSNDLEWLILLHKFYYFKELAGAYDFTGDEVYARKWMALIDSWIEQVTDGFIDSQVTGRRLQQWILSYHYFIVKGRSPTVTGDFFERFLRSVNSQTHYLCFHLTPEGNHRTLELYAIFLVAVTFPELGSPCFFLDFSRQRLIENMQRDLLADGVHRELSTDYHHTVLKNYLRFRELALLNHIELPAVCDNLLKKAIEFSYYVHKPDGFIPAINDGDCNSYLSLLKKAGTYYDDPQVQFIVTQGQEGIPPMQRSMGFEESGYYILRSDWTAKPYEDAQYLFFDCAPAGFGSHGHYDALNFELAAYGHSLVVDPGRYTYSEFASDGINWRRIFKGTAAHNTVVVDGMDQMPYHPGHPSGPEYKTTLKNFISASGFDFLHGEVVSGQYPVVHERMVFFLPSGYWIVTDLLRSNSCHNYDLYFHLAARAQGRTDLLSDEECHVIASPNLLVVQPVSPETDMAIEQGYVSPEYGVKLPAPVVKFSKRQAATAGFSTVLYPYKDSQPALQVDQIPVYQSDRLCDVAEATAIKILIIMVDDYFEDYFYINHGLVGLRHYFSGISCTGRMLYLRRDKSERIVNIQGDGIESVTDGAIDLLDRLSNQDKVEYQKPSNTLSAVGTKTAQTRLGSDVNLNDGEEA